MAEEKVITVLADFEGKTDKEVTKQKTDFIAKFGYDKFEEVVRNSRPRKK